MHYLSFDQEQLINLEYSLYKEILRTNKAGSYLCTTLNGCNTRKYHGLLVSPIENFGGEKHILLSALDETVIQNEAEFNLGIRRYQGGTYEPKGHKYIRNLEFGNVPKITYRVGGLILTKERLLVEKEEQVLIKYTLEEAKSETTLRLKPFLAFRNIHALSKANMFVNTHFEKADNGIATRLYDGYPKLYMQTSKEAEFIPVPDWYYNVEYLKELNRGYEYLEDLFVPGYFEFPIKKGESVIFGAGLNPVNPVSLKQRFTREVKKRSRKETFASALEHAAKQFVEHKGKTAEIIAGFPWFGNITRQTFLALPGLCLAIKDQALCATILDSYLKYFNDGFFPDHIDGKELTYHSADTSLWFVWVIQHCYKKNGNPSQTWKTYAPAIKRILEAYRSSKMAYISMTKEGLIYAEKENVALTWMDSYVYGRPVVQRAGLPVEINALWFNAICFALDLADMAGDQDFIDEWKDMVELVAHSFLKTFWSEGHGYLADVVNNNQADWAVRPNMVIAVALDYTPLSKEQQKQVLSVAKRKLLTTRGLRSLSPEHLRYAGKVSGNPQEREACVHMGAVHPWLLQFFVEGYLKIHKKGGLPFVKQIIDSFEEEMTENCVGTVSEMYDGNPPHVGKGAISQACNVAAIIYSLKLIQKYKK